VPQTPYEIQLAGKNVLWVLGILVSSIFLFMIVVQLLPRTPAHHWTILTAAEHPGAGYSVALERDKQLLGKTGKALTLLRPAGRAEIEGVVLDVVTEGEFIDRGKSIRVKQVDGNRVVVEAA
jgi:membrane-bound serine protease (ClpP class)